MNAPTPWADDTRFAAASTSFRGFFTELREAFVERETLFTQIELALLCREHVLIIGPPGTAKSAIAGAVLGRIVDETTARPSLFSKQLAENTVQTDLIGPVDFKVLTETGRTEHLTEEGMLGAVHAFLDEVFDGRDMLLRSILNVLHERELKHGRKVTPGRCECALMTSNRYLSEVLQRSPETLQAFADRISFICFAPKSFARRSSRGQMLHRAQSGQRPALHARLTLQQLDVLQEAVEAVEVPPLVAEGMEELADSLERELLAQVARLPDYVPTKYFSQRSMVKALWALKAAVVRDRLYRRPERRLVAEIGDLEMLRHFFLLGGPVEAELEALLKASADPRERAQLEIIRVEQKAFAQSLGRLTPSVQQSVERELSELKLTSELELAQQQVANWVPSVASTTARSLRDKLVPGPRHPDNRKLLLRGAETLVSALEARLGRSMQGEGRGVAMLGSVGDALELASRVTELQGRLPALSRAVIDFCRQGAQLCALAAEGAEFDEKLTLDAVTGLAINLGDELDRVIEIAQLAATWAPERLEAFRREAGECRERTAAALRRRATRALAIAPAKKVDPAQQLANDSRRLRDLEKALVALSARQAGLRQEFLAPVAEGYARAVVSQPFQRLEQLQVMLQSVQDDLRREGAAAEPALRACAAEIEKRIQSHAQQLRSPAAATPEGALSGEAFNFYRQQLASQLLEGETASLARIVELFRQAAAPPISEAVRTVVADTERKSVEARVAYLAAWWQAVQAGVSQGGLKSAAEADRGFDALVKSRFPQLVTREGELVRLSSAVDRLGLPEERVANLREAIAQVDAAFHRFSRSVIDTRGGKK
ncbi:MAG: AAA family ATPase [Myxococcaceae bacterium]